MRHGLVLVKTGDTQPQRILEKTKRVEGVLDSAVLGRFDVVAFIEAEDSTPSSRTLRRRSQGSKG